MGEDWKTGIVLAGIALAMLYMIYSTEKGDARDFARLETLADRYAYSAVCDADGKPAASGAANCVDLGRYVFVHGPVSRLYSKEAGHGAVEVMAFGRGERPAFGDGYAGEAAAAFEALPVSGG